MEIGFVTGTDVVFKRGARVCTYVAMNIATLFETQALWGVPVPRLMAEESAA